MHPTAVVANLASRQLGLVTSEQLLSAAVSRRHVRHLFETGQLRRLYPGVYVVAGCPPSFEQQVLAAVLAAGKTAFASHETALHMRELPLPAAALLEVTTVLERLTQLAGVRMHRSGLLIDRDVCEVNGIPVSTPERAIVDVSSRFDVRDLGAHCRRRAAPPDHVADAAALDGRAAAARAGTQP